jgi:hypothetical protein
VVNAFQLEASKIDLILCANSAREKQKWMKQIEEAVEELKKKSERGMTKSSSSSSSAAARLTGLFNRN